MSVKTLEANLTRIYRKLSVRTKIELANRLEVPQPSPGAPQRRTARGGLGRRQGLAARSCEDCEVAALHTRHLVTGPSIGGPAGETLSLDANG